MSRRRWIAVGTALVMLVALSLVGLVVFNETLPQRLSQHETIVLGQSQLVPGSTAAMRVVVRDSRDASPLPGAGVKVLLRPTGGGAARTLFEGRTNADGTLPVSFTVPADAATEETLVVETTSSLGSDRLEKPVTLVRSYRLLVSTDKPLYQPGQVIHIRVLGLGSLDRVPAGELP